MSRQVIVELDETMAKDLESVAPSRSRKRSAFIRQALRKALDAAAEARMAEAYRRIPDTEPVPFFPELWEPRPRRRRTKPR